MKIINVLATGPSLSDYKPSGDLTVGVNKSVISHFVNHLVIIDLPRAFKQEDLIKIKRSDFERMHTQLEAEWRPYVNQPIEPFELMNSRGDIDLNSDKMPHSISAPFCGVALAYKLGATVIDLYGADYRDHPAFNSPENTQRVVNDFKNLQRHLINKGVSIRVTSSSLLSEFLPLIPQSRLRRRAS